MWWSEGDPVVKSAHKRKWCIGTSGWVSKQAKRLWARIVCSVVSGIKVVIIAAEKYGTVAVAFFEVCGCKNGRRWRVANVKGALNCIDSEHRHV